MILQKVDFTHSLVFYYLKLCFSYMMLYVQWSQ